MHSARQRLCCLTLNFDSLFVCLSLCCASNHSLTSSLLHMTIWRAGASSVGPPRGATTNQQPTPIFSKSTPRENEESTNWTPGLVAPLMRILLIGARLPESLIARWKHFFYDLLLHQLLIGEFLLTERDIKCKPRGKIYSLNEGYEKYWDEAIREYVKSKKFPEVCL